MRMLLLPAVAALVMVAACDNTQTTTAPTTSRAATPTPAMQASAPVVNQGKPAPAPTGFTTVTVVESNPITNPGGGVAGQVFCPAGTTRLSGGYAFTTEGSWSPVPAVTQSMPYGNGWWVRTIVLNNTGATFKVYAVCAS
jgi:hypothetical protein